MQQLSQLIKPYLMILLWIFLATIDIKPTQAIPQPTFVPKPLAVPNQGLTSFRFVQIAAGERHTCALTSYGAVMCWGDNSSGQLGDDSNTARSTPVRVVGLNSGVIAIAAGAYHTCALLNGGAVKCWGKNGEGELGDGKMGDRSSPGDVVGLSSGVTAIAAGGSHSCVIVSGMIKCWGRNSTGQLGDGSTTQRLSPVDVMGLGSETITLTAGNDHSCAVTSGGGVKCWGGNAYGQLGDSTLISHTTPVDVVGLSSGITALAAGVYHSCALTSVGGVKCWGRDDYGQLGDRGDMSRTVPVDVIGLNSGVSAITANGIVPELSGSHTCALMNSGGIKCWGRNDYGQLGDGTITNRHEPVDVVNLNSGIVAITTGSSHTCGVTSNGDVTCWGSNDAGQLGDGTISQHLTPIDVKDLNSEAVAVTTASAIFPFPAGHTCVLTTSGGIKCWGWNDYGHLGDGTTINRVTPVEPIGLSNGMTAIAAGYGHTCALTSNGGVKCWGANRYGEVGDGTTINRTAPMDVIGLSSGVIAVATGSYHTCALTSSGGVKCWGRGDIGELGNGIKNLTNTTPVDVSGLSSGVRALAVGGRQTCVLMMNDVVKCWGRNNYGQLGDGTIIDRSKPVDLVALSNDNVRALALGSYHTCVITGIGAIKCWGRNSYGQLGDGTIIDRWTSVNVVGLNSAVTAITAGTWHTCVVTSSGGAKCWGDNSHGELGDGWTIERLKPVDVVDSSTGIHSLAAGNYYTCAVLNNGGVKCWGDNGFGQLGDGSSGWRTTPVDVVKVPPLIKFEAPTYSTNEKIGTAMITVTLDATVDTTVTVDVILNDGTAEAGKDYETTTHTLIFAPGVNSQPIPIHIIDDTLSEGDETFTVSLINAQNGIIDSNTVPVTIVDDANSIIVQDETGRPMANATVELYVGGSKQDSKQSDSNGRVIFYDPPPASTLIARSEISDAQHAGWPYKVYLTNLDMNADGSIQPTVIGAPNSTKVLTVRKENPLVLFDLIVSVEWCGTQSGALDTPLAQLQRGLRSAADYLYDVTDGQFTFGHITIYDCGRYWEEANLQITTSNHVRPYAAPGGITAAGPYTYTSSAQKVSFFFPGTFRMGRAWNRFGEVDAPLDKTDAVRTLVHEFLHWAFFVFDEYFVDKGNGLLDHANCVNQDIRTSPQEDPSSASIMFWPYNTSELDMRDSVNWSEACQSTEQFQVHGESSWETLLHIYSDTQLPPRWIFHFPTWQSKPNPGPDLPLELPIFKPEGSDSVGLLNNTGELAVRITDQNELQYTDQVQIFLLKQKGAAIKVTDQGTTNHYGDIPLIGVEEGDTILVISWDGKLSAANIVSSLGNTTITLKLMPAPWTPLITARPSIDAQGNEIGLSVQIAQVSGTFNALQVNLVPVGGSSLEPTPLLLNSAGVYSGTILFPGGKPIREAYLVLRVVGQRGEANSATPLVTTYAIGGAPGSHGRSYPPKDPASSDGYCSFHLPDGTFSSAVPAIVMPTRGVPPLAPARHLVSMPCYLGVPPGVVFNKPVPLILYYNQRAMLGLDTQSLRIEHFNEDTKQWENLGGLFDALNYFITVAVNQPGLYIVTAKDATSATFYGTIQQDIKSSLSNISIVAQINGQSVTQTTSMIDNTYEINVPADDPTTEQIEGGRPGQVVTFLVNGDQVSQTGIWQPGSVSQINLIIQNPGSEHKTYLPWVIR